MHIYLEKEGCYILNYFGFLFESYCLHLAHLILK